MFYLLSFDVIANGLKSKIEVDSGQLKIPVGKVVGSFLKQSIQVHTNKYLASSLLKTRYCFIWLNSVYC